MDHSYTMTQWQDAPSAETPLNADNLNHIEQGIGAIYREADLLEQRILSLEQAIERIDRPNSHIGMIVMSTTLDTMGKVIKIYGGEHWIMISGRFLLGASTGESSKYAVNSTGGSPNAILPLHRHPVDYTYTANSPNGGTKRVSTTESGGYNLGPRVSLSEHTYTEYSGVSGTDANMPPYKAVYIWERTA